MILLTLNLLSDIPQMFGKIPQFFLLSFFRKIALPTQIYVLEIFQTFKQISKNDSKKNVIFLRTSAECRVIFTIFFNLFLICCNCVMDCCKIHLLYINKEINENHITASRRLSLI